MCHVNDVEEALASKGLVPTDKSTDSEVKKNEENKEEQEPYKGPQQGGWKVI